MASAVTAGSWGRAVGRGGDLRLNPSGTSSLTLSLLSGGCGYFSGGRDLIPTSLLPQHLIGFPTCGCRCPNPSLPHTQISLLSSRPISHCSQVICDATGPNQSLSP